MKSSAFARSIRPLLLLLLTLLPAAPTGSGKVYGGAFCSVCDWEVEPVARFSAEYQTALLFGINNRNDYLLAPQFLRLWWKPADSPPWEGLEVGIAAQLTPVVRGPESFLGGGLLAVRQTWRPRALPVQPYIGIGFGAGGIDSRGALDGQGQDFVFLIQGEAGLRWEWHPDLHLRVGILYQHMSNAGLSEPARPNVGLDALGPIFGLQWRF